jgi:hypothetical protein
MPPSTAWRRSVAKPVDHPQHSVVDEPAEQRPEAAALRQRVVPASPEDVRQLRAPYGPRDLRVRGVLLELGEVSDHVEGRVAATDHEHAPAGVACALGAEQVGDAVLDPVREAALAGRPHAACPQRVRGGVGAARVEHGASEAPLLAGVRLDEHVEGGVLAAVGLQLVEPGARDLRDPCAEARA